MHALLVSHAALTLVLCGLIWTIQVVHYPLFARVGADRYVAYQAGHGTRITALVAPLMLAEVGTAGVLVYLSPGTLTWLGAALLAVVWLSTALFQVPQHARLEHGFDAAAHRRLVATNWVRTMAWTARGLVVMRLLLDAMSRAP